MPNHIMNKLTVEGDQSSAVFDAIAGKDGERIDFNKIIKMPDELNIESGTLGGADAYLFHNIRVNEFMNKESAQRSWGRCPEEDKPQMRELGNIYANNVKKYGHPTWYTWSIENWGTEWNAYATPNDRDTQDTIWFETAWSGVKELIRQLSARFPNCLFRYQWSDEDTGNNVGNMVIQNGSIVYDYSPDNGSNLAYELAIEHRPDVAKYVKLVDGEYRWVDEED